MGLHNKRDDFLVVDVQENNLERPQPTAAIQPQANTEHQRTMLDS